MINPDLLKALSKMKVPMVVFLGGEDEEESELLKEMKRHNEYKENLPYLVPSPG